MSRRLMFSLLFAFAVFLVRTDTTRSAPNAQFVHHVLTMIGDSYAEENCSRFVCLAHGKADYPCAALDIWNGCGGKLELRQEIAANRTSALAYTDFPIGSVIAFHGAHVAVYLGDHTFVDSTPERGVARFEWQDVGPNDLWYRGPVRVLEWKQ